MRLAVGVVVVAAAVHVGVVASVEDHELATERGVQRRGHERLRRGPKSDDASVHEAQQVADVGG
jgi:hypothetical protein